MNVVGLCILAGYGYNGHNYLSNCWNCYLLVNDIQNPYFDNFISFECIRLKMFHDIWFHK